MKVEQPGLLYSNTTLLLTQLEMGNKQLQQFDLLLIWI